MVRIDSIKSAFTRVKEEIASVQGEMDLTKEILALLSTADAEKEDRIAKLEVQNRHLHDEMSMMRQAYVDLGENILDYLEEVNLKIVPSRQKKSDMALLIRDI